ncbi:MAG TPA: hypothetical protein VL527_10500 [Dongiaceae bacterium]|nr:hypothetical protein [Dongiaceae bacterium]
MNVKPFFLITALALASCSSPNSLPPLSSIRPSVATEGTLANEQLVRDTTAAIHKLIGGTESVVPFVIQKPVGQPGRKAWRELWVYDPAGRQQQFIITFQEDGKGSADYTICAH